MFQVEMERSLHDLDKDGDGFISMREFIGENVDEEARISEMTNFEELDKDGKLTPEELRPWALPDNEEVAKEEAEHLLNVKLITVPTKKAWWWNIQENMLNANITVFGLVSTGVIHGIEKDKIYKLRIFAFSNGGDGKKSPDVFFTLGGQVIYDPNQADILNSAPTSQMIASIVGCTNEF
ncbi:Reticulocalbin-2 [Bulinus truncatus]|nr:Reticulocalbin-2 [Bulinus truncatus]